jgi:hypothetical protein
MEFDPRSRPVSMDRELSIPIELGITLRAANPVILIAMIFDAVHVIPTQFCRHGSFVNTLFVC